MSKGREITKTVYAEQAAAMIKVSRFRSASMAVFAKRLSCELGWGTLSRQAIYEWESGRSRVPAVAVFAAARVANLPLAELFALAERFRSPMTEPGTKPPEERQPPEVA